MTTSAPLETPPIAPVRRGPIRRLYDWVLHWADTPYAIPALFGLSFAESSFFPIPPDVLLIALCIGEVKKSYRFALWCSIASVLGGMAGYAIGMFLWDIEVVKHFFYTWVPGVNEHSEGEVRVGNSVGEPPRVDGIRGNRGHGPASGVAGVD